MARPCILVLVDVPGWAWGRKAEQLVRYLNDEFDVLMHVRSGDGEVPPPGFDLYHTFELPWVERVPDGHRCVTGLTAHVLPTWGAARVQRWASRAVAMHANSLLLLREIQPFHPHCYYTPNGVDPIQFYRTRPRASDERLVVGHVGKPNPRKGSAIIRAACEAAGVELRLNQRRYGEALTPDQMREWYQDVHVLAFASDFDGTPNPALEGAACEVAPVTNRIGNMPEFVEDGVNGFLVEREVDSLAARLRELAANVPRAIEMGRRARETVLAAWAWERQVEHYRVFWRAALALPASGRRS